LERIVITSASLLRPAASAFANDCHASAALELIRSARWALTHSAPRP
jgi:hypothetical protein